jgi:hypothetical protein
MTDYKQLCRELVWLDQAEPGDYADWRQAWNAAIGRARAALAEPEPQQRCIYSPVQIAECGGPCQQGPEHCDCGELWVTEPAGPTDEELAELYRKSYYECEDRQGDAAQVFALRVVLARWGK